MGVLDDAAAGLGLREQHVLGCIEFVDALHRADIDARSVLHVDARFGDDREAGHGSSSLSVTRRESGRSSSYLVYPMKVVFQKDVEHRVAMWSAAPHRRVTANYTCALGRGELPPDLAQLVI